jgi:hypothetical protein
MDRVIVQIREEIKRYSLSHLSKALKISASELTGMIANAQEELLGKDKFNRDEVKEILRLLQKKPEITFYKGKKYFERSMNCSVQEVDGGVFLIDREINFDEEEVLSTRNEIKIEGLWRTKGLNNHVHLKDIVKNPIAQMFLAEELIRTWTEEFKKLSLEETLIVYWNGRVDSTVCLYLRHNIDEPFLEEFEKHLRMKDKRILDFSSWNELNDFLS